LWSETVRNDALVDYMLFPRLIAFAERAWHHAPWEPAYRPGESFAYGDGTVDPGGLRSDWASFADRMGEQLRRLDRDGIAYRIAPPGAQVVHGMLEANSEFPGQAVEYRIAGGAWTPYRAPVKVTGPVQLRTRSADGRRASRTVEIR
jgi:hexosaminidase